MVLLLRAAAEVSCSNSCRHLLLLSLPVQLLAAMWLLLAAVITNWHDTSGMPLLLLCAAALQNLQDKRGKTA